MEKLKEILNNSSTLPFLFIGSGFSRRYLDSPDWKSLLENLCDRLKLSRPFNYYFSLHEGNLPKIAESMANELHEIWWSEKRFSKSVVEYGNLINSKSDCLKVESSLFLKEFLNPDQGLEDELDVIKQVKINGIITTNWDTLLEDLFPDFNPYIGQDQMIFNDGFRLGDIYKIHGCTSKPNSLILTEQDYAQFHESNAYLASKLTTIFLEHPIIFIGYSLTDSNIRNILSSITRCLKQENLKKLQRRLIFLQRAKGEEDSVYESTITIEEFSIPALIVRTDDFKSFYTILSNLERRIPLNLLQQIEGMVYDVVRTKKPTSKVFIDAEGIENSDLSGLELVYGFNITGRLQDVGLTGVDTIGILKDVINPKIIDSQGIIEKVIPELFKRTKNLPYFIHLNNLSLIGKSGRILAKASEIIPAYILTYIQNISRDTFYPSNYSHKVKEVNKTYKSIESVLESDLKDSAKIRTILLLDKKHINLKDLESFIHDNDNTKNFKDTNLRKLICLYDYLKYCVKIDQ